MASTVKSVRAFVKEVKSGSISVTDYTSKIIEEAKKNSSYNYLNVIAEKEALAQAREIEKQIKKGNFKGKLAGLPVTAKDCLCVKGVESTAGSKILEGYNPTFDATAVSKAKNEGSIIIGKNAQDEFGFGAFSVNVGLGFKIPKNPHDTERCTGGSSGGSAGFTSITRHTHVSLGESTGGSIVDPASFCGVVGLCPTYGRVSRYGLIDYGSSLDKIGSLSKTVDDAALMLEVIAGLDRDDSTSLPEKVPNYSKSVGEPVKGLKIGVVKEFCKKGLDKGVEKVFWDSIKKLEAEGAKIQEVSLPLNTKYGVSTYYLIAVAEASTNLAKYCGMRYGLELDKMEGNFDEYFTLVRSLGFGKEAKRRAILGTFTRMAGYRDAYYLRGMKVRTKLIQEYKSAFKRFDVLANPTMPIIAPKFKEIEKLSPWQHFMMDATVCPPNLAGLPHISVPIGFSEKMPVGLMFTADHLNESVLVRAGSAAEKGAGK